MPNYENATIEVEVEGKGYVPSEGSIPMKDFLSRSWISGNVVGYSLRRSQQENFGRMFIANEMLYMLIDGAQYVDDPELDLRRVRGTDITRLFGREDIEGELGEHVIHNTNDDERERLDNFHLIRWGDVGGEFNLNDRDGFVDLFDTTVRVIVTLNENE